MNDWNVLVRWSDQPEFTPLWHTGHTEAQARAEFDSRRNDAYFGQAEYKLVKDYSGYWDHVPTRIDVFGTFTVPRLVMDNYTEVPKP